MVQRSILRAREHRREKRAQGFMNGLSNEQARRANVNRDIAKRKKAREKYVSKNRDVSMGQRAGGLQEAKARQEHKRSGHCHDN